MTRRLAGIAAITVLMGVGLAAAEFWETKPFLMWSDKEAERMITDSPWAQKLFVVVPSSPQPEDSGTGRLNTGGGGGGDGGGGGGGGGGGRGGGGGGGGGGQLRLTITWRSALPIKQAVVRGGVGLGGVVTSPTQAVLDQKEAYYVITIAGVPRNYQRQTGTLKASSVLRRDKKPNIEAADVRVEQDQGNLLLGLFFPRTDAITIEDKEVEVYTKLGTVELKKKFKIKDMIFKSQLEM